MAKQEGIPNGYRAVRLCSQRGTIPDGRRLVQQDVRPHESKSHIRGHTARGACSTGSCSGHARGRDRLDRRKTAVLVAGIGAACNSAREYGMWSGDACPYVPGLQKLDWPLQDPKGQPLESVRNIRDEIRARVTELAEKRNWI